MAVLPRPARHLPWPPVSAASTRLSRNRCCSYPGEPGPPRREWEWPLPAAGQPLDLPHPGYAEPTCPPTFILTGIRAIPEDAMATGLAGMAAGGEAAAPVQGLRALGLILGAAECPGQAWGLPGGWGSQTRPVWGKTRVEAVLQVPGVPSCACSGLRSARAALGQQHGGHRFPESLSQRRGSFSPTVASSRAEREVKVTQL